MAVAGLPNGKIDVEDMLTSLGVAGVRRNGNEVQFVCPFHGDHNPSASMNVETTAWVCYACHACGNAVTFIARMDNTTPMRAAYVLRERYAGNFIRTAPGESFVARVRETLQRAPEGSVEPPRTIPEACGASFEMDWEMAYVFWKMGGSHPSCYPFERGLLPKTLKRLGIGFDSASLRMTIPVRDRAGRLLGFKGRDVTGESSAKYLVMGGREGYDFQPYEASKALYLLHLLPAYLSSVIVCEGELNAAKMYQHGWRNMVAISGSSLSEDQVQLLRSLPRLEEVILFFDSDDAGRTGAHAAAQKLKRFMRVRIVGPHEGDPMTMNVDAIDNAVQSAKTHLMTLIGDRTHGTGILWDPHGLGTDRGA